MILSIVSGLAALLALSAAMALLAACNPLEMSLRSAYACALAVVCLWCVATALSGNSAPPEAVLMVIIAAQSWQSIREGRVIRSIADLNPLATLA
jgi:hypothetical protein